MKINIWWEHDHKRDVEKKKKKRYVYIAQLIGADHNNIKLKNNFEFATNLNFLNWTEKILIYVFSKSSIFLPSNLNRLFVVSSVWKVSLPRLRWKKNYNFLGNFRLFTFSMVNVCNYGNMIRSNWSCRNIILHDR